MLQACIAALLFGSNAAPDVNIYRDKWGVPSIIADDYAAAMYGLGYMHVVDDGERVALNYKIARGHSAEVLGNGQLLVDGFLRGLEIEERAERAQITPETRRIVNAYLAGANRAMQDRRDKLPAWVQPFTATDVLSLTQFVNCAFPLLDLARQIMPGVGSNQFAVGASRSSTGHPILSMDPHLEWNGGDGGILWYETGVYTRDMAFRGVSVPGLPGCVMGHNDRFGWSITNNNPQLFTRYTVVRDPADATRYSYHGEWRPFRSKEVVMRYRSGNEMKEQRQNLKLTEWGPMVPLRNEAMLLEPLDNFKALEQVESMMRSRSAREFRGALGMHGLSMWNFVYAGSDGTLGYQYNASLHKRDASVDWTKPVPGDSPATRLQANYWTMDELPHVENPSSDLLVNCNSSPNMAPVLSELPGKWPTYVTSFGLTSRYRMLSDLLKGDPKIDPFEARQYATDTKVPFAKAAIKALADMPELVRDPMFGVLKQWDQKADVDSRGTAAFAYWLAQAPTVPNLAIKVAHGQPWTDAEKATVKETFVAAEAKMRADGLPLDARWGEVLRMRRGAKEIGVEGFNGITSNPVVAVNPSGPGNALKAMQPRLLASRGSSWRMVVSFEPGGVRSWSILPYGNSHDPSSPYFANQMDLFAVGRYKETVFGREAAMRASSERITLVR